MAAKEPKPPAGGQGQAERRRLHYSTSQTQLQPPIDTSGSILCGECWGWPIRVADGGPVHWAVCDALFGFLRELERAEIVEACDGGTWDALRRAYRAMASADYLTAGDRAALLGRAE